MVITFIMIYFEKGQKIAALASLVPIPRSLQQHIQLSFSQPLQPGLLNEPAKMKKKNPKPTFNCILILPFFRNGSWATVCKYITPHRACGCPTSHSSRILMLPKIGYYIFMEKTDNGMNQFIQLHCLQNSQLKSEFCSAALLIRPVWSVSLERGRDWARVPSVSQRVPPWARAVVTNTKTPDQAGRKLPVGGLEAAWISMVWITLQKSLPEQELHPA